MTFIEELPGFGFETVLYDTEGECFIAERDIS